MTKRLLTMVVLAATMTLAHGQAGKEPAQDKKQLVQKVLALQQPMIENMARSMAERPVAQLMQAVGQALQTQVPPERREAVAKAVEADLKKFVEEATPLLRERALKLAPSTLGVALEEKFSAAELKQLIAWLESPVNKKFQQIGPEMQSNFMQKLAADAGPLLDPKLQALQQKLRATFTGTDATGAAASSAAPARPAPTPARP